MAPLGRYLRSRRRGAHLPRWLAPAQREHDRHWQCEHRAATVFRAGWHHHLRQCAHRKPLRCAHLERGAGHQHHHRMERQRHRGGPSEPAQPHRSLAIERGQWWCARQSSRRSAHRAALYRCFGYSCYLVQHGERLDHHRPQRHRGPSRSCAHRTGSPLHRQRSCLGAGWSIVDPRMRAGERGRTHLPRRSLRGRHRTDERRVAQHRSPSTLRTLHRSGLRAGLVRWR